MPSKTNKQNIVKAETAVEYAAAKAKCFVVKILPLSYSKQEIKA